MQISVYTLVHVLTYRKLLSEGLKQNDPAIYQIIEREKRRQKHFINLIPSENFTSQAVLEALGSVMQSKTDKLRVGDPGSCVDR